MIALLRFRAGLRLPCRRALFRVADCAVALRRLVGSGLLGCLLTLPLFGVGALLFILLAGPYIDGTSRRGLNAFVPLLAAQLRAVALRLGGLSFGLLLRTRFGFILGVAGLRLLRAGLTLL